MNKLVNTITDITLTAVVGLLNCALSGCDNRSDVGIVVATVAAAAKTPPQGSTGERDTDKVPALSYVEHDERYNPEAPIPPQCYTKTEGKHNPCYVCHQTYQNDKKRTNTMADGYLQGLYAFSDAGLSNGWKNLFKDRRDYIDSVSDEAILKYISEDNFTPLIEWMRTDAWSGVVPAIENLHKGAAAFDQYGLAKDGSRWVAFNYKPFPSTFWPTNGATDDVMIRLDKAFSEIDGQFSRDVYFANLSLLEMAINDLQEITSIPLDETALKIDLDGDGRLSAAVTHVLRRNTYLGDAGEIKLSHMLYPKDTEFLHTVRYIGVAAEGNIYNAARMKEVRYMKKNTLFSRDRIVGAYYKEAKEKHSGNLPTASDFGDRGISNSFGWLLWGFIEDADGHLRKQHFEEQFFCTGCHKTIGGTIDQTFSFPRKVAGAAGWGYIDLRRVTDTPNLGETKGEYLTYMERVNGGDEYRQNGEMLARWFNPDGAINAQKIESLGSVYELITPSAQRALTLNKAYQAIVKEQSYLFGRDVVIQPATNVYQQIDPSTPPLEAEYRYQWDIRPAL